MEGGMTFDHLIKETTQLESTGDEITLAYDSYNIFRPHLNSYVGKRNYNLHYTNY